jgi:hypothetical protein
MTKTLNGEGRGIYGLPGQDIFITQIEFALDKTLVGIWLVIRSFSIRYSFSFFSMLIKRNGCCNVVMATIRNAVVETVRW